MSPSRRGVWLLVALLCAAVMYGLIRVFAIYAVVVASFAVAIVIFGMLGCTIVRSLCIRPGHRDTV